MSSIKQRRLAVQNGTGGKIKELEKPLTREIIEGYNNNTNHLVRKFDKLILLPGVIFAAIFLGLALLDF